MKNFVFAALLLLCATQAQAAIVTQEIPYKDGDVELTGFLAYDDTNPGKAPGVAIIHEWWGHNDYARSRAEQLAGLGFVAFAIDMYGTGKIAATPEEAGALSKPFYDDRMLMRKRAQAGIDVLKAQPQTDAGNIAVIGYCFGGTVALEVARGGADVKGVVSFHGGLATPMPAQKGVVKAQVLALNGKNDSLVPEADRAAFLEEMTAANVNFKAVDYPGAVHAFTNPAATEIGQKFNMPVAYNAEADKQSFADMRSFFAKIFEKK